MKRFITLVIASLSSFAYAQTSTPYAKLKCEGLQDNGTTGLTFDLTQDRHATVTFVGGDSDGFAMKCGAWVGDKDTFLAIHCVVPTNQLITFYYVAATAKIETSDVLSIANNQLAYNGSILTRPMTCQF